MPDIQQLSASVINKIAAGEVIERPASVVKELMENAVDAGATRIDVSVEKGGLDAVRVVDNGCGIPSEQLPLAVASHATSKIRGADDLFQVGTLGFRGEALASIAEVSRLVLRSRPPGAAAGARLEAVGGRVEGPSPCGCQAGTAIEIEQLFFNTPVRRKFMKSAPTEMGHVSEAFSRIALAFPGVHFTLRQGDRELFDLPPVECWSERIASLHGRELASKLLWVESRDEGVELAGFVAHPSESRSHNRMQYLFLNGRHIRDRALGHALAEAYRGLLITGRYPVAFLRLDMPPNLVDVNVHPTKLEVRFQDGGRLYSQLLGTLRTRFLTTDMNHPLATTVAAGAPAADFRGGIAEADEEESAAARRGEEARAELAAWAKGQLGASDAAVAELPARQHTLDWEGPAAFARQGEGWSDLPMARQPLELVPIVRPRLSEPREAAPAMRQEDAAQESTSAPPALPASARRPALQVYNRYLIAESDEGVVIIDQHALHEKVLYEQIRDRVLAGGLESQKLLVPETVDLSASDVALAMEHRETLARLGLSVEEFGETTVLISSRPAMLRQCRPAELLRELLDRAAAGGAGPDRRDLLDELLHMMSCKAAIKAGDPLAPEEIEALLELRHLAQDPHHCPHGRPTSLVFTREDLDRQFKRT
jgi:DNA mismatch repair protein MutL